MLYGPVNMSLLRIYTQCLTTMSKIRDTDSALLVAQLLFLEAEETSKPIHLYINSPGGSVTAGLAIYDTVRGCAVLCAQTSHTYLTDAGNIFPTDLKRLTELFSMFHHQSIRIA